MREESKKEAAQIIGLALLSLLLVAASPSPFQSQETGGDEHQKAPTKQPDGSQQQQIERLVTTLQATNDSLVQELRGMREQARADAEQRQANNESWYSPAMLVSIGLLVVGVFYTVFARRQWSAILTQAEIANESLIEARKAAAAAKDSVIVAEDNVRLSIAIATDQQRPWIVPTGKILLGETSGELLADTDLPLRVELANVGKGPAFHLEIHMTWRPAMRDATSPDPMTSLSKPPEWLGSRAHAFLGALGPGATHMHFLMSNYLDKGTHGALMAGTGLNIFGWGSYTIAVYGWITYRPSPYGTTHETRFCLVQLEPGWWQMAGPHNHYT